MNLAIVPRQIEKTLFRLWPKKSMCKKCIPHSMQWNQTPRKKFRFPLLPKEKNYGINIVRTYSGYQINHKT